MTSTKIPQGPTAPLCKPDESCDQAAQAYRVMRSFAPGGSFGEATQAHQSLTKLVADGRCTWDEGVAAYETFKRAFGDDGWAAKPILDTSPVLRDLVTAVTASYGMRFDRDPNTAAPSLSQLTSVAKLVLSEDPAISAHDMTFALSVISHIAAEDPSAPSPESLAYEYLDYVRINGGNDVHAIRDMTRAYDRRDLLPWF
jgi:hypothetical protein